MLYRAVIFDFDGVLSKDRFYKKVLLPHRPNIYTWIQNNIFKNNKELVRRWMRGEVNSSYINNIISENTHSPTEKLTDW